MEHWDGPGFTAEGHRAEATLLHSLTSRESMQLLQLANEGINLMDAWLNTSVAEPLRMTAASSVPGSFADTDREGQITVAGYAAFATCVFEAGQCMTDRCMRNDADINGDADLDDYREMQFLIDSP